MTLQAKFTEKYGISPLKLVEDTNYEYLGFIKKNNLTRALERYIDEKKLNIEVNSEFEKDLVEAFAEAGERFPESGKIGSLEKGVLLSIPNVNASVPKSKGTLENFKEVVGTDELRPVMSGVFVSEDGKELVGTDAHKLVIQKTNEYSEYAGKIIDLKVYTQTKGKKITFIDGKYPNYNAVIPKDNPNEIKNFDTYALYNAAKSSIAVHKLVEQTLFNINLKLPTVNGDGTMIASFNPVIVADVTTFALVNGWNKFTFEYSTENRAYILNFGEGNIALIMPIMNSYGEDAGLHGGEVMTPEEIMDKYKFAGKMKSVKPAATKPARPSAPVSSEPFKEFKGEYDEENTTYVLRRDIESITLTNGEVLGKNDVVQGFYRVKKKMAHGGGLDGELKSFQVKVFVSPNPQTPVEETVVLKPTKSLATLYVEDSLEPNWISKYGDKYLGFEILTQKMEHGGSMYAKGGGVGSIVNMNNWKVIDRDRDLEKMKKICDTIRKMGYESTIVKQNNVYVVLQESEKESEFRQVYARGGEIKVGDKVIWRGNEYTFSKISNNSVAGMIDEKYHLHSYKKNVSDAILDSLKDVKKMAHGGSMYADGGNLGKAGTKTYKLRAEGLNDFLAFLQNDMYFKMKSFTIEPIGVPDVIVTFETSSSLSEIKEKLKEVPDSHVMLETVKPINEYTGERERANRKYAHGGSMYAGGGYVRPSYDTRVSGKYDFKTNTGLGYELLVVGYERKNDDSDSLYFDDLESTAKKELGSIIIKNNSWKNLSKGQPILAISETGIKGRLTRVGNLYAHGGSMYAGGGTMGRVKVGTFNEAQLKSGEDKLAIEKAQKETGLTYIDSKITKKGDKMFMEVYLIPTEEYLKSAKFANGGSMYADKIPSRPFLVEIKPLFEGEEPLVVRVSPDTVGEFTAGYTIYSDAKSTKKVGYVTKPEMEGKIENGEYKILSDSNKFANSGSMSSSHEVGDTVTFNSVMGGTKTGTIISKMGEEGFRIQVGNGFATVKKSAIV
jgi:hypothetical protein